MEWTGETKFDVDAHVPASAHVMYVCEIGHKSDIVNWDLHSLTVSEPLLASKTGENVVCAFHSCIYTCHPAAVLSQKLEVKSRLKLIS